MDLLVPQELQDLQVRQALLEIQVRQAQRDLQEVQAQLVQLAQRVLSEQQDQLDLLDPLELVLPDPLDLRVLMVSLEQLE